MVHKRQYLFISFSLMLFAVILILPYIESRVFSDWQIKQIYVILITVTIQIFFLLQIRTRYKASNFYLLHPLFYINVATILYFFIPFAFFLFNPDFFYKSYIFPGAFRPLVIFCSAMILFNFVCSLFDTNLVKQHKSFDLNAMFTNIKKSELQIFIIIYVGIWALRLLSIYTGTYWHSFLTESIIAKKVGFSSITSSMAFFITVLSPVVWFVFSSLYFTRYKSSKKYKTLFKLFVLAEMTFYFPCGSKLAILAPLISYFFAGFLLKQNIRKQFIVFSTVVILAMPVHGMFRQGSPFSLKTGKEISASSEKGYLFEALVTLFVREDIFSSYFIFTERGVQLLYGKTYMPVLATPIPRPLWPGKPVATNVNEIGRHYGLIGTNDYVTSPGVGPWGEAYLNFGYIGVLLIGIFMSLFSLILFKYMLEKRNIFVISLCFYSFFYYFTAIHGFWGGFVSNTIKMFMVFAVLSMFVKTVQKTARSQILPYVRKSSIRFHKE